MLDAGPATIRALVDGMAVRAAGSTFLIAPETGREVSFAELGTGAAEMEALLSGLGVGPDDRVVLLLGNGLFTAQLLLGAMYTGRVPVPLGPGGGEAHLAYVLAHCDARVAFVAEEHAAMFRAARRRAGADIRLVLSDPGSGVLEQVSPGKPTAPRAVLAGESEAGLYYTSGTTGRPKGVRLSHRGLLAGAASLARGHQLTRDDRALCVLPLYHLNALVSTLLPTLLSGGSVVLPRRFDPTAFWGDVRRHGCTWSGLVPTIVSRLLLAEGGGKMRFARCSSAPLEASQQQAFEERFDLPLIEAMGMTEAGATIFAQPLPPAARKPGSVGVPLDVEVRVVDAAGRELPYGRVGEILVRGASVMLGYLKDPDGTAAVLDPEGWLHTGDLGSRDADGDFFITGRLKELILKAGENIAPREIELALTRHPAVREAVAVGVPDRQLGQDIVAFVVLRAGAAVAPGELQRLCAAEIGPFKTPTEVHVVEELPRGASGKVQRLGLAEKRPLARHHQARAQVERAVAASWAQVLGLERVSCDDDFFDLGGDSLLATMAIARLRQELGVDLPLSAIFEAPTVSRLSGRILEGLR